MRRHWVHDVFLPFSFEQLLLLAWGRFAPSQWGSSRCGRGSSCRGWSSRELCRCAGAFWEPCSPGCAQSPENPHRDPGGDKIKTLCLTSPCNNLCSRQTRITTPLQHIIRISVRVFYLARTKYNQKNRIPFCTSQWSYLMLMAQKKNYYSMVIPKVSYDSHHHHQNCQIKHWTYSKDTSWAWVYRPCFLWILRDELLRISMHQITFHELPEEKYHSLQFNTAQFKQTIN